MAYKISDATKAKLNACCKTCEATEFGTRLQNLGADLDLGSTNLSEKFVAAELTALGKMCEANKAIATKFNLLVDKLLDVTKADIPVFTTTEVSNINNSCFAFSGIGTVLNGIIAKINANEIGADITVDIAVVVGGATATASTTEAGTLAWSSSDAEVATIVEATGAITAIAAGTTNITYLSSTGMTNTKAVTVAAE